MTEKEGDLRSPKEIFQTADKAQAKENSQYHNYKITTFPKDEEANLLVDVKERDELKGVEMVNFYDPKNQEPNKFFSF